MKILVLLILLSTSTFVKGQDTLIIEKVAPIIKLDTGGLVKPPNMTTQSFEVCVYLEISDTIGIDSIYIQIGRMLDSTDVLDFSMAYDSIPKYPVDSSTVFPSSTQFAEKKGQGIRFDFGAYVNVYTLYYKVWARDRNGILTPINRKKQN